MMIRYAVVPLLGLALLACDDDPTGPREVRYLGTVSFAADIAPLIETPDTVVASMPFVVSVRTFGGGCEREGPTETEISADEIVVSPFDFTVRRPGIGCAEILKTFDHEATLTWPEPGEITLVFRGVVMPDSVERRFDRRVVVQ